MGKRIFKRLVVVLAVLCLTLPSVYVSDPGISEAKKSSGKKSGNKNKSKNKKIKTKKVRIPKSKGKLSKDGYRLTIDGVTYPVGAIKRTKYKNIGTVKKAKSMIGARVKVKPGLKKASHDLSKIDMTTNAGIYDSVLANGRTTYGYNKLDSEGKKLYDDMYTAATNFARSGVDYENYDNKKTLNEGQYYSIGTVKVNANSSGSITREKMYQVWTTFEMDNPQFYWLDKLVGVLSASYMVNNTPAEIYILCNKNYLTDASRDEVESHIVSVMKNVFDPAVNSAATTYDKVKAIHDAIVDRVDYSYLADGSTPSNTLEAHSIIGFFRDDIKKVVCEGYSEVFEFVTDFYGIPSVYVTGYCKSEGNNKFSGGHAWNMVSLDGGSSYHYLDITWDDNNSKKTQFGPSRYIWYLIGETAFTTEHFAGVSKYTNKTIIEDNLGWIYSLPSSIGNAAVGSSEDKSYYKTYGAYFTNESNKTIEATWNNLNTYLSKAPKGEWLQILFDSYGSQDDAISKVVGLLGKQSYSLVSASHLGSYHALYSFKRPVTDISLKSSYKTEYVLPYSPQDPKAADFGVSYSDGYPANNADIIPEITWYTGDKTGDKILTNAEKLQTKPVAAGTYTMVAVLKLKANSYYAEPYCYLSAGEVRQRITITNGNNPIKQLSLTKGATEVIYGSAGSAMSVLVTADEGTDIKYQWYAVDQSGAKTAIEGASKSSYTPSTMSDVGEYTYMCVVSATKNGETFTGDTETVSVKITPRELTGYDLEFYNDEAAFTKVYDGTQSCTGVKVRLKNTVFSDKSQPDIPGLATYNSADAGNDKTIKFVPTPITAGNYRISNDKTLTHTGVITKKENTDAPPAPVAATVGTTSITLKAVEGCEYKIKSGESDSGEIETGWQDKVEFIGLLPNTEYTFYQRFKETENSTKSKAASAVISTARESISKATVTLDQTSYVYTGSQITPKVTVKMGDVVIPESEYSVSYDENKNAGTGEGKVIVMANADGTYEGSTGVSFDIVPF
ncbi:MAG TPA: hypothetical protein DCP06_01355, partial [Lachnospiraceae bacterium]|nr:hypothetical protein [Lachnospiraceae bacterium]